MMPDNNRPSDSAAEGAVEDNKAAEQPAGNKAADSSRSAEASNENSVPADESAQAQTPANDEVDPSQLDEQEHSEEQPPPLSETEELQLQLEQAQANAAAYWDRLLRLQAEMENQRKRAQNDLAKARKFALESIVEDLLPVKDSLELGLAAVNAADTDLKAIIEGVDLTVKMLSQVFEKNNIVEVNPIDEKFNPEFHQAMSMQEVEGLASNTVTSVMQKGYTLNDRLVRPALVMVAK